MSGRVAKEEGAENGPLEWAEGRLLVGDLSKNNRRRVMRSKPGQGWLCRRGVLKQDTLHTLEVGCSCWRSVCQREWVKGEEARAGSSRLQTPHPKAGILVNRRSHWKDFKKRMNMMGFVSHSGKLLCCCM